MVVISSDWDIQSQIHGLRDQTGKSQKISQIFFSIILLIMNFITINLFQNSTINQNQI